MYCRKCAQALRPGMDKAIGEPRETAHRPVWVSILTEDWVCNIDGDEHEPGSLQQWAVRIQQSLAAVQEMVEAQDITAEQGLYALMVDAGLAERSNFSIELNKALMDEDPDRLFELLERART